MNDTNYGISTDPRTFKSIHYLKHEVQNWNITASYACFIADNTEHCMPGGDKSYYEDNVLVLEGLNSWFSNKEQAGKCATVAYGSAYYCSGARFDEVSAYSFGGVSAVATEVRCDVDADGTSYCSH